MRFPGFWSRKDRPLSPPSPTDDCMLPASAKIECCNHFSVFVRLALLCSYAIMDFTIAYYCFFSQFWIQMSIPTEMKNKPVELSPTAQEVQTVLAPSSLICTTAHFLWCNTGQAPTVAWIHFWTHSTIFSPRWIAKRLLRAPRCLRIYFYDWFWHLPTFRCNWSLNVELLKKASTLPALSKTILQNHILHCSVYFYRMSGQRIPAVWTKPVLMDDIILVLNSHRSLVYHITIDDSDQSA